MRGSQSVENMRAALMDLLGKGGQYISDVDRAYADKIYEMGGREKMNPFVAFTSTAPIQDLLQQDMSHSRMFQAQKYGLIGTNLASRYALPAGGLTLAGKGLVDIINMLDAEGAMEYHDENIAIPFNPNA